MMSAETQIRPELNTGERLLWSGRPRPYSRFDAGTVVMVLLLGAFIIGISRAAILAIRREGVHGSSLVFAIFLLMPLGMIVWVVVLEPRREGRTAYGVTNQRAIIMQGFGYRNLYGLPLERSTTVLIREGFSGVDWWRRSRAGDTIGTISFAGYTMGAGDNEHTPSFNRIEDARQVFALIERVKGGGGERSLWS